MKQKPNIGSLVVGLGVGLLVGATAGYVATRKYWDAQWQAATELAVSGQSQVQLGIVGSLAEQLLKQEEAPEKEARRLAARYLQSFLDHAEVYPSAWRLAEPEDFARTRQLIAEIAAKDGTGSAGSADAPTSSADTPARKRVVLPAP